MRKTLLQIILLACALTANAQAKYDLNGDGEVNVADVTELVNYILTHSLTANAQAKYDLNGDGEVNVADVTELVNYILTHSNDGYKSCPDSNHPHWIDLGLPSGTQWCCCNEGASTPEAYGGYYEFGQVASAPTLDQIEELLSYSTSEWTIQNRVNGRKFTSSNGGSIFLPAAGYNGFIYVGSGGYYWSSEFEKYAQYEHYAKAKAFEFDKRGYSWLNRGASRSFDNRLSVRPVRLSAKIKSCPDNNHPHWIDLGLPSGTKWRCCNEGASTPEAYGGYYEFGKVASAPSLDQIKELLDYTTDVWTTQNGVNGRKFTGNNGGTIFLPAAGRRWHGGLYDVTAYGGYYWSSTPYDWYSAYELTFDPSYSNWSEYGYFRSYGCVQSVRPVR